MPSEFPTLPFNGLAFVGEAPGEEEAEKLRPFVGPSGKIFNAILQAANIDRRASYVGNVYDKKLYENDVAAHKSRLGSEAWTAFYLQSRRRLIAELDTLNPTVIVPLGGTALEEVFGSNQIMAYRGQPTRGFHGFERFKVVPALHPAFIMHTWKWLVPTVGDFIRASAEAEIGPDIVYPNRRLNIRPTEAEVHTFLERCKTAPLLSCDIETGWGQVRGFSFAPTEEEGMYVPLIDLSTINKSYWPDAATEFRVVKAVKALFEHPVPKLGQNFGNYDTHWLLEKLGIRVRNYREDTRLLHKALYPELSAGLPFMGATYSRQGAWKHWVRHGGKKKDMETKRDS